MTRAVLALALVTACWHGSVPVVPPANVAPAPAPIKTSGLIGSVWKGRDLEGPLTLEFFANGLLVYTTTTGRWDNGRWRLDGRDLYLDTNNHYSDYIGVVEGKRMHGHARNVAGEKWMWEATRER